jgi:hypothetical protein
MSLIGESPGERKQFPLSQAKRGQFGGVANTPAATISAAQQ